MWERLFPPKASTASSGAPRFIIDDKYRDEGAGPPPAALTSLGTTPLADYVLARSLGVPARVCGVHDSSYLCCPLLVAYNSDNAPCATQRSTFWPPVRSRKRMHYGRRRTRLKRQQRRS